MSRNAETHEALLPHTEAQCWPTARRIGAEPADALGKQVLYRCWEVVTAKLLGGRGRFRGLARRHSTNAAPERPTDGRRGAGADLCIRSRYPILRYQAKERWLGRKAVERETPFLQWNFAALDVCYGRYAAVRGVACTTVSEAR